MLSDARCSMSINDIIKINKKNKKM